MNRQCLTSQPLFKHTLFKSILDKAKASTHMGISTPDQGTSDPSDPSQGLFDKPVQVQEIVPTPKLFMEVVQWQWVQPGTQVTLSGSDRRLYTVEPSLEELLKLLPVDAPVAALTSTSVLPPELLEGLKLEDKAEKACHKTHQAAAWAIKVSPSASFFSRASLLWLQQLLFRTPAGDTRLRQDLNKIKPQNLHPEPWHPMSLLSASYGCGIGMRT